jgi:hypothetical protein
MKVKDLIQQLSKLDQDLEVFVEGYEGGLDRADIGEIKDISLDVNSVWYYVKHEDVDHLSEEHKTKYKIVKGVILI